MNRALGLVGCLHGAGMEIVHVQSNTARFIGYAPTVICVSCCAGPEATGQRPDDKLDRY